MLTNVLRLAYLMIYILITSQLLFYFFILSDTLKLVSLENFIELRKVIDVTYGHRFKVMYYTGLALSLTMVAVAAREPRSAFFITALVAFICLLADVAIALKGNIPLNTLFNNFQNGDTSQNWTQLRLQWLKLINLRAIFICVGLSAQLVTLVWTRFR